MTRFRWGVATDVGRVRTVNQDSAFASEGFFVVADGMGGHRGGEVASSLAVETLIGSLPLLSSDDLLTAIQESNRQVYWRSAEDASLRGMGTTMCVLALIDDGDEPQLLVAHVGDSRVYAFVDGVLEQMTEDHSVVGELLRQGRITSDDAAAHPQRNMLTRAMGIEPAVTIDSFVVPAHPNCRWLLCSDGLFNEVSESAIVAVLGEFDDPADAANELVRRANDEGGRDNITVLVVDVLEDDELHATILSSPADGTLSFDDAPTLVETPAFVVDTAGNGVDSIVTADPPTQPAVRSNLDHHARLGAQVRAQERQRRRRAVTAAVVVLGLVIAVVVWLVGLVNDDGPAPVPSSTILTTTTVAAPTTTAP